MHADSMFVIGTDHIKAGLPCQDYAVTGSGKEQEFTYAIVSDGCSSGRRTDMGSRITATSMERALLAFQGNQAAMWQDQRESMLAAMAALGCEFEDLYATCIYAYYSPKERYVHVRGDGAVAWKFPDGSIEMVSFDWGSLGQNNPPFYPAYGLVGPVLETFKEHYAADPAEALYSLRHQTADGEATLLGIDKYSLQEGIEGIRLPIPDEAVAVAIFTDGIMRVPELAWHEVIQRLLAFKSPNGAFVRRRMMRFLDNLAKDGSRPADDLACAAIHLQGQS